MEGSGKRNLPAQGNDATEPALNIEILGCRVSKVTLIAALGLIERWIQQRAQRARYVVATGFHGLWEAQKDPEFQKVLNSADLFCPDGIAPVWLSRLNGEALPERVPGPDLIAAFLAKADKAGYSSFFFGDTAETLAALRGSVQKRYPGHRIAGVLSPPFRATTIAEDSAIIEEVNNAKPDVLWVGLGMPKQDWWIYNHLDDLRVPVVAGVGAAFRFLSGGVKRAPAWVGDNGFEWLWRLAAEPRKLWRRDLIDGPRFLAYAFLQSMRARRAAGPARLLPTQPTQTDANRPTIHPTQDRMHTRRGEGYSSPVRGVIDGERRHRKRRAGV
jgi:N-acetylglucosaminyldiphosphoundecaprenol N-acetyl-beta-D-mannosaminyltransferase